MSHHQARVSPPVDADGVVVTVAGLAGPLPSGVDLEALVGGNGSRLTDDDIQRLIVESPFLLRSRTSNFDPVTQVQRCHYTVNQKTHRNVFVTPSTKPD